MSDDIIGYGKPPKRYQFKKGKSGNSRGRPKSNKPKSHLAILNKILSEKIDIRESGQQKKVTKLEAFFKKIFADAMNGNKNAIKIITHHIDEISKAIGPLSSDVPEEIVVKFVSPKIRYEYEDNGNNNP